MRSAFSEPARNDPNCEIRLGTASWDDGTGTARSVKYAWFDKNGKVARGGSSRLRLFLKHWNLQLEMGIFASLPNRHLEMRD
jgi:hypothetical protein